MNRRSFLQACLASATAPYVVTTAGVLMPVKKVLTLAELYDNNSVYLLRSLESIVDGQASSGCYRWVTGRFMNKHSQELLGWKPVDILPGKTLIYPGEGR